MVRATQPVVPRPVSVQVVRRLAITRQGLAGGADALVGGGKRASVGVGDVVALVERLGYVQLDPISVVERSPLLVLWSRLGPFDRQLLDEALFGSRALFEYWSHAASIVPTSDLPIHRLRMRTADARWGSRVRDFLDGNAALQKDVLGRLATEGPLPAQAFGGARVRWESSGWTDGRDVDRLLDFLWIGGQVVVAGRSGGRRSWALAEQWFDAGSAGAVTDLDEPEVVRRQVERSVRALGVGSVKQIVSHYNAGRYPNVAEVLREMVAAGALVPVSVHAAGPDGKPGGAALKGEWFVHADDVSLMERVEAGGFEGRTVLLSPFDNLIIDRARAELLFDFEYRMEIYVPKVKRRFGYYVLPILHEDRLIGRLDARSDRKSGVLQILAWHAEPKAAKSVRVAKAVSRAIEELATACGLAAVSLAAATIAPDVPLSWVNELE